MKKFFLLLCSAFFTLSSLANVGDTFNAGGCSYQVIAENDNIANVELVANLTNTDLNIPQTVTNNSVVYNVTGIASDALKNSSIKSVVLPLGLTIIGKGAFQNCSELTSVTLPSSLSVIEYFAFAGCENLTNITIPANVTYIGRQAFAGCKGLKKVIVPASVKTMGEDVFLGCVSLTEISLPENMESIKEGTFEMCSQINTLNLPQNIKYVDNHAFNGCSGIGSLTLPESIEGFGAFAFAGCSSLTSLMIPQNICMIPDGTFAYCSSLQSIALPNSVVTISSGAFKNNPTLTHVTLPSNLTSLGEGEEEGIFERCDAMTELTIPAYVDNVGEIATHPYRLKSVFIMGNKIPDGIDKMDKKNRLDEDITIYVKRSVYNNLYPSGEWNGFKVSYLIPVEMVNAKGKTVKYKTMCRDFDVDLRGVNNALDEGQGRLSAYVVDDANGELGMVFMDEILYIPSRLKANLEGYKGEDEYVGVVLKGTPGATYYYEIGENDYSQGHDQWLLSDAQAASKAPHAGSNMMKGVADASYISSTEINKETGVTMINYGLNNNAFRKISGPGWMGYNKSYLSLPEDMANSNYSMTFTDIDGTTDTISVVEFMENCDEDNTYDLYGRQVNDSYKGVVIKNGKKWKKR